MTDSTGKPGITGVTSGVVNEEVVVTIDSLLVLWTWLEEVLCWLVVLPVVLVVVLLVVWVLVDVEPLVDGAIVEVIVDV